MKRLKYLTVMLAALVLCLASCKKGDDGAAGPTGATGAQGLVGPAGPKGADGKNGSVIYSGNTAPLAATGIVGDFYLNTATSLLYGPKTAAGWGTGFSLKGATGATGATGAAGTNGNTTLSGTGAPSASLGNVGDFYLDKTSYFLYGPKTGSGWGPAVNLHGPAGPAGTANVIYSGWNYATNFRDTIADNSNLKAGDLAAPALTQSILDHGTVMLYFTFGGGVYPLPYTSNAGGKQSTISYLPRLGHFIATRFTADNSNSIPLSTVLQYRYVIIPGGISAATAKHININDYESVRKFYMLGN